MPLRGVLDNPESWIECNSGEQSESEWNEGKLDRLDSTTSLVWVMGVRGLCSKSINPYKGLIHTYEQHGMHGAEQAKCIPISIYSIHAYFLIDSICTHYFTLRYTLLTH